MVTIDYSKTLKDLTNHFGWKYGVYSLNFWICWLQCHDQYPSAFSWCVEIDHDIVIKMLKNLKAKLHIANQNGLSSLLKF